MKTLKKKPVLKVNIVTCIMVITILVSSVMVIKGFMLQPAISVHSARAEQIREEIEYEKQRIAEIDAMMEKVGTDEYIEKVAREKLGMIKSDEIVFIDISGQ